MDHVIWSRRFAEIPEDVLNADVDESYAAFTQLFGKPQGFASPGFYADARVSKMVDRLGFVYDGDAVGGEPRRNGQHWTIPVTLTGKGTVPFLEFHGARHTSESDFLAEYERHLAEHDRVVVYGHPCYEGVRPSLLRELFERALKRGFRFLTLSEMAAQLGLAPNTAAAAPRTPAERLH
jgi:hypothetical protein